MTDKYNKKYIKCIDKNFDIIRYGYANNSHRYNRMIGYTDDIMIKTNLNNFKNTENYNEQINRDYFKIILNRYNNNPSIVSLNHHLHINEFTNILNLVNSKCIEKSKI